MPDRPNIWYIFEKRIVQVYQKLYSHVSKAQIQKYTNTQIHKHTNTQIQHMTNCQKIPTMWYISEKKIVQGCPKLYSHVSKAQIQKYKYTNTQTHKYTNTAYDKVPERPTMWYIFEKRIVQGYQK